MEEHLEAEKQHKGCCISQAVYFFFFFFLWNILWFSSSKQPGMEQLGLL